VWRRRKREKVEKK
jgi:hypothetical protein